MCLRSRPKPKKPYLCGKKPYFCGKKPYFGGVFVSLELLVLCCGAVFSHSNSWCFVVMGSMMAKSEHICHPTRSLRHSPSFAGICMLSGRTLLHVPLTLSVAAVSLQLSGSSNTSTCADTGKPCQEPRKVRPLRRCFKLCFSEVARSAWLQQRSSPQSKSNPPRTRSGWNQRVCVVGAHVYRGPSS